MFGGKAIAASVIDGIYTGLSQAELPPSGAGGTSDLGQIIAISMTLIAIVYVWLITCHNDNGLKNNLIYTMAILPAPIIAIGITLCGLPSSISMPALLSGVFLGALALWSQFYLKKRPELNPH